VSRAVPPIRRRKIKFFKNCPSDKGKSFSILFFKNCPSDKGKSLKI
jgi:hypothetical protein